MSRRNLALLRLLLGIVLLVLLRTDRSLGEGSPAMPPVTPGTGTPSDPDLKPGNEFQLRFPGLKPDRHGHPALCTVSLPASYDPAKKYGLAVWIAGGEGDNIPNTSFYPPEGYVSAGLPLPLGDSGQRSYLVGNYPDIWKYHRTMIEGIVKKVPNIARGRGIIGGFSNGAHCIDGMLRLGHDSAGNLNDYFNVFVAADGGCCGVPLNSFPTLQNSYAWVCWGEKSMNIPYAQRSLLSFKGCGAVAIGDEIKGSGHSFPQSEAAKIRLWIQDVVLPDLARKGQGQ